MKRKTYYRYKIDIGNRTFKKEKCVWEESSWGIDWDHVKDRFGYAEFNRGDWGIDDYWDGHPLIVSIESEKELTVEEIDKMIKKEFRWEFEQKEKELTKEYNSVMGIVKKNIK